MAQVVYRGTAYDTVQRRQAKSQQQESHVVTETYRGIRYNKEVKWWQFKRWTSFNLLRRRNKKSVDYTRLNWYLQNRNDTPGVDKTPFFY